MIAVWISDSVVPLVIAKHDAKCHLKSSIKDSQQIIITHRVQKNKHDKRKNKSAQVPHCQKKLSEPRFFVLAVAIKICGISNISKYQRHKLWPRLCTENLTFLKHHDQHTYSQYIFDR